MFMYLIPLHDLHSLFIVPLDFQRAEKRFQQKQKLGNNSYFDAIFLLSQTSVHVNLANRWPAKKPIKSSLFSQIILFSKMNTKSISALQV